MGKAYNVMAATCPSRTVLHRIGARWTVFVVNALADGPRRFTDLKAHIQGITPKVLTETLRSLEVDGLISRHEYAENPPHVEYALTPLGRSLLVPLRAVRLWAEQHVPDIEAARAHHQDRTYVATSPSAEDAEVAERIFVTADELEGRLPIVGNEQNPVRAQGSRQHR